MKYQTTLTNTEFCARSRVAINRISEEVWKPPLWREEEEELIDLLTSLKGKLEVHGLITQLMKSWYSNSTATKGKALVDFTAIPLEHIKSPEVL